MRPAMKKNCSDPELPELATRRRHSRELEE
jgi:hypothetical protein